MSMHPSEMPPKKKTSGLTILLIIIGGLLLVMGLVIGVVVYKVMSNPKGRAIVSLMGESIKLSQKAQKAPGTKELRASGCKQALVFDFQEIERLMHALEDASTSAQPSPYGEMVMCSLQPWDDAQLECDALAKTYVGAVGSRSRPFVLSVQRSGKSKPECSVLYEGGAVRVRDVRDGEVATPPQPSPE